MSYTRKNTEMDRQTCRNGWVCHRAVMRDLDAAELEIRVLEEALEIICTHIYNLEGLVYRAFIQARKKLGVDT